MSADITQRLRDELDRYDRYGTGMEVSEPEVYRDALTEIELLRDIVRESVYSTFFNNGRDRWTADLNEWIWLTPDEHQAIKRALDADATSGTNAHQHMNEVRTLLLEWVGFHADCIDERNVDRDVAHRELIEDAEARAIRLGLGWDQSLAAEVLRVIRS